MSHLWDPGSPWADCYSCRGWKLRVLYYITTTFYQTTRIILYRMNYIKNNGETLENQCRDCRSALIPIQQDRITACPLHDRTPHTDLPTHQSALKIYISGPTRKAMPRPAGRGSASCGPSGSYYPLPQPPTTRAYLGSIHVCAARSRSHPFFKARRTSSR